MEDFCCAYIRVCVFSAGAHCASVAVWDMYAKGSGGARTSQSKDASWRVQLTWTQPPRQQTYSLVLWPAVSEVGVGGWERPRSKAVKGKENRFIWQLLSSSDWKYPAPAQPSSPTRANVEQDEGGKPFCQGGALRPDSEV